MSIPTPTEATSRRSVSAAISTRCKCGLELFLSDNFACRSCGKCNQCYGPLGEKLYFSDYGTDEVFCSKDCRDFADDMMAARS